MDTMGRHLKKAGRHGYRLPSFAKPIQTSGKKKPVSRITINPVNIGLVNLHRLLMSYTIPDKRMPNRNSDRPGFVRARENAWQVMDAGGNMSKCKKEPVSFKTLPKTRVIDFSL